MAGVRREEGLLGGRFRCIVFDLGGVLIRFDPLQSARELCRLVGGDPADLRRRILASGLAERFGCGAIGEAAFAGGLRDLLGIDLDDGRLRGIWADIFRRDPGMEALAAELAGRVPLVLLSNTDAWHFTHVASLLPVLGRFRARVLSYEAGLAKPDPRIYRLAAAAGDAREEECIFIDDLAENVAGAEAVGMTGILFAGREALVEELRRLGADGLAGMDAS